MKRKNKFYQKICHSMTNEELKIIIESSKKFLESAKKELSARKNKTYNETIEFLLNNRFVHSLTPNGDRSGSVKIVPTIAYKEQGIIDFLRDNGFLVYDIYIERSMIEEPIKEWFGGKEYILKKAVYEKTVEFKFSYK